MNWHNPQLLRDWLSQPLLHRNSRPPEGSGIYVVSEQPWVDRPDAKAEVLWVGQARYLRDRIRRLVAEILGFTTETPGYAGSYYHNGGHKIWLYCLGQNKEPLDLFLGWHMGCACLNCAEAELIKALNPRCNSQRGNDCHEPGHPLSLQNNCPCMV